MADTSDLKHRLREFKEGISSPCNEVRLEAERALRELSAADERTIPTLLDLIRSADRDLLWLWCKMLIVLKSKSIPGLLDLLSHPELGVRLMVALTLRTIKPGREAIPALAVGLQDRNSRIRGIIAEVLAYTGPINLKVGNEGLEAAAGIERMNDEATALIRQLKTFYLVGEYCKKRHNYWFNFVEIARIARRDDWEIRRDLEDVSKFFQRYFRQFGYPEGDKVEVADDREFLASGSEKLKVINRGQGNRRTTICDPLGRAALAIAADYLRIIRELPSPWD